MQIREAVPEDWADPEIQKFVQLSLNWGVKVYLLPPEADFSYEVQDYLNEHHRASRSPADGPVAYCAFGHPIMKRRGQLFLSPNLAQIEEGWPAIVVLMHELAHAVVRDEGMTVIWEQEMTRLLFPDVLGAMKDYVPPDIVLSCHTEDPEIRAGHMARYEAWGVTPGVKPPR